jgi:methylated-DNA-[protein]-cysteine S-methyltransferase
VDVHSAHLADTRAGPLTVWVSPAGVRRIEFGGLPRGSNATPEDAWPPDLREAVRQIREYFSRERRSFDLELDFPESLTDFQRDVYERLRAIEYGHVVSYGQVARDVGKPDMARAVGQAVGANPIPIVVPCHRVVASDGSLTGFGGGLRAQAALLKLEGIDVTGTTPSSKVHPEVIPLDL